MKKIAIILMILLQFGCSNSDMIEGSYVIEVTTFKYNSDVNPDQFWEEDAKIEATYTSVQPGYISRESGYSAGTDEVVVVVRWKTMKDAEASMKKFMGDASVMTYANMINGNSMKMNRYATK